MENISRIALFFLFLYSASETHSASLEERFLSPPSVSGVDMGSDELTPPETGLDTSISSEFLLELTDEKRPLGPFLKYSTRRGQEELRNKDVTSGMQSLANLLDKATTKRSESVGQGGRFLPRGDWGEHPVLFRDTLHEGFNDGLWTALDRRYALVKADQERQAHPQLLNPELEFEVVKRNPACLKKCMAQGFLHPAQCHSLC